MRLRPLFFLSLTPRCCLPAQDGMAAPALTRSLAHIPRTWAWQLPNRQPPARISPPALKQRVPRTRKESISAKNTGWMFVQSNPQDELLKGRYSHAFNLQTHWPFHSCVYSIACHFGCFTKAGEGGVPSTLSLAQSILRNVCMYLKTVFKQLVFQQGRKTRVRERWGGAGVSLRAAPLLPLGFC